jgi:hypothetical protein
MPSTVTFYFTRALPWTMAVPTIPGTIVDNILLVGVILTGLIGGMIVMARRWRGAVLYVLAYAVLLYFYTWVQDRFLIPILPLILPLTLIGLASVAGRIRRSWALPAALAFAVLAAIGGTIRTTELVASRSACDHNGMRPPAACLSTDQISYFAALDYINNHTAPGARILAIKPEPLYLNTGRRTVYAPRALTVQPGEFLAHLRAQGTDYVLLGSLQGLEPRRLPSRMLADCEVYAVERFIPPRTYLFRLREVGEAPASDGCHALLEFLSANRNRDFERDP